MVRSRSAKLAGLIDYMENCFSDFCFLAFGFMNNIETPVLIIHEIACMGVPGVFYIIYIYK